jgi:hypothetical protein
MFIFGNTFLFNMLISLILVKPLENSEVIEDFNFVFETRLYLMRLAKIILLRIQQSSNSKSKT